MRILRPALAYLRQAEIRVRDATEAYGEGNYPYAARPSQEAVELCLKVSLRLVRIEYPEGPWRVGASGDAPR